MTQNQKVLLGLLINAQGCGQMFETINVSSKDFIFHLKAVAKTHI